MNEWITLIRTVACWRVNISMVGVVCHHSQPITSTTRGITTPGCWGLAAVSAVVQLRCLSPDWPGGRAPSGWSCHKLCSLLLPCLSVYSSSSAVCCRRRFGSDYLHPYTPHHDSLQQITHITGWSKNRRGTLLLKYKWTTVSQGSRNQSRIRKVKNWSHLFGFCPASTISRHEHTYDLTILLWKN